MDPSPAADRADGWLVSTLVALAFAVLLSYLIWILVRRARSSRRVDVSDEIRLAIPPAEAEQRLVNVLTAAPRGRLMLIGPWHHAHRVKHSPAWAMVFGIVGVILIRQELRLDAALFHDGGTTVLRLSGSTELSTLTALRNAFDAPV